MPGVKPTIVWREVTRNCHVGYLDSVPVVTIERSQRLAYRVHGWRIVVLGDRYTWNKVFCQHDPQDLASTKSSAEARVRWAIDNLYRALHPARPRKRAA
jgi:hypothetical protein